MLIRKLLKETQAVFAKRFTGVSLGMQKSYESGTTPSLLYLNELSKLSGISIARLQDANLDPAEVKFSDKAKEQEKPSTDPSPMQILGVLAEAFRSQTEILRSIERNMARAEALTGLDKKLDSVLTNLLHAEQVEILGSQWQEKKFDELQESILKIAVRQIGALVDEDNKLDESAEGGKKPRKQRDGGKPNRGSMAGS